MALAKTRGLVLHVWERGETSQGVHLLTSDLGKIRMIARGIKRSKALEARGLEYFYLLEMELYQRSAEAPYFLREFELLETFFTLRTNLLRVSCGWLVLELMERHLAMGQGDKELFSWLELTLRQLGQAKNPFNSLWVFLCYLVKLLGYTPHLSSCLGCATEAGLGYFSPRQAGMLCQKCVKRAAGPRIRVDAGFRRLLDKILRSQPQQLGSIRLIKEQPRMLYNVCRGMIAEHLQLPELRSLRFLRQLKPELRGWERELLLEK